HSHYKAQRMDGLYGLLIIEEDDDSYKDYVDINILISDWYPQNANELLNEYHYTSQNHDDINATPEVNPEPIPSSVLIDGIGKGNCKADPDFISDTGRVYKISEGVKYRFRIINVG
ncbi:16871_t:CDS:2, partial [Racocetra fulgida]